ncbi:MAG: winged helix-turn-helix transcriptional regulator [Gemmatimonadetes bacterium]|nr:winged helix-turn-helix transcriptional regulator [Gemmatimonadota bacterium]
MQDTLSQTFSALADPTRRAILARLRTGEATVSQLAEPFLGRMTLPGVTKHLKVLERAGLVTKGREAQWRPCTLNAAPLKDAAQWMEEYRVHMEASLDRLGDYLKTITISTDSTTSTPDTTDDDDRDA